MHCTLFLQLRTFFTHKNLDFYLVCSPLGARSQSASVLACLQELKDIRDELTNKESQLRDAEHQLSCLKGTADKYVDMRLEMWITNEWEHKVLLRILICKNLSESTIYVPHISTFPPFRYRQLKQQYELKVEEEQILQAKLQQSSFHQQQEELERLRKTIGQKEEL